MTDDVDTGGGSYVAGDAHTGGGSFAGRDAPEARNDIRITNKVGGAKRRTLPRDQTDIEHLTERVDSIHDALVGNDLTGSLGWIEMTRRNQIWLWIIAVLLIFITFSLIIQWWNIWQIWNIVQKLQESIK